MNTASNLGPHTQTDRGTWPAVGLWVHFKSRYTTGAAQNGSAAVQQERWSIRQVISNSAAVQQER